MPSFAGSVPVGAASGVNLPTSLETTNISPPPPITVDIPVVVETPVIPTTPGTVTTPVVVETPVTPTIPGTVTTPVVVETPVTPTTPGTVTAPVVVETPASSVTSGISTPASSVTSGTSTPASSVTSGISTPASSVTSGTSTPTSSVTSGTSTPTSSVTSGTSTPTSSVTSGISTPASSVTSGTSTPTSSVTSGTSTPTSSVTSGTSTPTSSVTSGTSTPASATANLFTDVLQSEIEELKLATSIQAGQNLVNQVSSGLGSNTNNTTSVVRILPVSPTPNSNLVSTTATITVANRSLNMVLTGTSKQVANAAGFIGTATSAGFSLAQIQTGTNIAMTGADFSQVTALINSLSGLMVTSTKQSVQPDKKEPLTFLASTLSGNTMPISTPGVKERKSNSVQYVTIEPARLDRSILIFNQLLDTSDDVTVIALSQNAEFLTIWETLKRLRVAFDN
ncbi:hypothetical protein BCV64_02375 [Cylindrospermopsis raciborskii MVCC14]|nr:hypothetical protein BCV64_02375 [Cylindrospermopsis raciborskii MVCC14]